MALPVVGEAERSQAPQFTVRNWGSGRWKLAGGKNKVSRLRSEPEKALNLGRGSRVPMTTLQLQLRDRGQQRVLLQRLETRLYW